MPGAQQPRAAEASAEEAAVQVLAVEASKMADVIRELGAAAGNSAFGPRVEVLGKMLEDVSEAEARPRGEAREDGRSLLGTHQSASASCSSLSRAAPSTVSRYRIQTAEPPDAAGQRAISPAPGAAVAARGLRFRRGPWTSSSPSPSERCSSTSAWSRRAQGRGASQGTANTSGQGLAAQPVY